jgi:nucleotide-binding universal stress UspA family protein
VSPLARILVPLDGSEFAEQALPRAAALAAHHGAELVLVQALDIMSPHAAVDPMDAPLLTPPVALREPVDAYLRRQARRASAFGGPSVRVLVLDGPPVDAIAGAAEREGADLVVLTTHGRSGWRRLLLGSVARRVVLTVAAPILVCPLRRAEEVTR